MRIKFEPVDKNGKPHRRSAFTQFKRWTGKRRVRSE
jgi:hypothetical protein